MRDERYQMLVGDFGEPTDRRAADAAVIEKYRTIVPERLIRYWQEEGFCQFRHGELFTVNPDDWQDTVDEWLRGTPYERFGRFYAIQRSGFGHIQLFNSHIGATTNINTLMGWITSSSTDKVSSPWDLDNTVAIAWTPYPKYFNVYDEQDEPLLERVQAKLGPLRWNEMYAFEPALALGGLPKLENVAKLDWRVHMSLLRQIQEPHVPFTDVNVPEALLKP